MELVVNGSPSAQNSLLIDRATWAGSCPAAARRAAAGFLLQRNRRGLAGPRARQKKSRSSRSSTGWRKRSKRTIKTTIPGYLEVVYHLFSMAKKEGPVVMRMRTGEPDR